MSPIVARNGPAGPADRCPQFEVERTQGGRPLWAAFVKVFGCRPMTVVRHTPGAGVRKPPREETAVGWASRRRGRYGELSGVEGQQQRRRRGFKRLARTGDAHSSGAAGSRGEDLRARAGVDAMLLRAPSWLVES